MEGMSARKGWFCLILPALFALGVSGCRTEKGEEQSKMKGQEHILEYMENKYDQEFTYKGYQSNNREYVEILAECSELPGDSILVYASRGENGEWTYKDNYMAYYYHDEVEASVRKILQKIYGEDVKVSVHIQNTALSDEITPESTIEEFTGFADNGLTTYIAVNASSASWDEREKDFEDLLEGLKEKKICINGVLAYVKTDCFSEFTEEMFFKDITWEWSNGEVEFCMNAEFEAEKLTWSEGKE